MQQLNIACATAILAALSLAVWSFPVRSLLDINGDTLPLVHPAALTEINRVHFPAYLYHNDGRFFSSSLPINRVLPNYPIYFAGSYRSQFGQSFKKQPSNFIYPYTKAIRQNVKDIDVMINALHARRTGFENEIMPSFDAVPRHASFTDKSFLSFFSKVVLPVRFVNRVSSFPSFKVTYKNITLTGLAIG